MGEGLLPGYEGMMKKWVKKMRGLSIRNQIFWSMAVVSILTTAVLGVVIFILSKKTMENNYQNLHLNNLQVSSNIIDIQLKPMIEQSRGLLTDESFVDVMENETSTNAYFSSYNNLKLERILGEIVSYESAIQSALVVNSNGNMRYYTKNSRTTSKVNHYYRTDNILEEDWVETAGEARGKEVFFGYNVLYDDEANDCFSMVKMLINPYSHKTMGYLVLNTRKTMFEKAFGTKNEGYVTNRYMILDVQKTKWDGEAPVPLVYYNGAQEAKDDILEDYTEDRENRYLYSAYENITTGWEIINVIEKSELSHDSSYIGWITLLAGISLIAFSFYVSAAISRRIIHPLDALEKTIEAVGEGNYKIEAEFDDSEIGKIGNKFKGMVTNNLELRERLLNTEIKEREAELLLLQSQINPHFLYNTLDSLYFMAVIHNADDMAEMVMALSDTFKLSLNQGNKLIYVKDEIAKIKAYMKIQNMRYHGRFEFVLDVAEDIMDLKILSFILQPVVENSMYHGLEAKRGNGRISVKGYRDGDSLHFILSDNGVGIKDMAELEKGYGVRNIRERIRLFYGDGYTVNFTSEVNVGTTATFILPIVKEEKDAPVSGN